MRIIAKRTLREFWEDHADSEEPLKIWHQRVFLAEWKTPQNIKDMYASASFLGDDRVVFNIKGNKYRLIVRINYDFQVAYIRFIGTHADYDKIDANSV